MRSFIRSIAIATTTSASLLIAATGAQADPIPYPNIGTMNPTTYTFVAAATGDLFAYFAGSNAGDEETIGMLDNGVSTGVFGLDNHGSAIGQSLDLGTVHAGDTLTFVLNNFAYPGNLAYSDPSLNALFDAPGAGANHVYATAYTGGLPAFGAIPAGLYIGWEDLPAPVSDFDYNDTSYVLNVVPEPSTLALIGSCLLCILGWGLFRRRTV